MNGNKRATRRAYLGSLKSIRSHTSRLRDAHTWFLDEKPFSGKPYEESYFWMSRIPLIPVNQPRLFPPVTKTGLAKTGAREK